MAKAVADTVGDNQAGFAYDDALVSGFSHMHDSGTGGVSLTYIVKIVVLLEQKGLTNI